MKKITKGGLILAVLMASNAQAALVKVDMTGTVNYGYKGSYDYNYNTGVYNNNSSDLTSNQAHFSFIFDTSKAPDQSYSDNWNGYDYWGGNYSYSNNWNNFSTAVSSFSGEVAGSSVSGTNLSANTQNYGFASDNWGNYTSGGASVSSYNYNYTGNSWDYSSASLSSYGSSFVNAQDFISAFMSNNNPISFYLSVSNGTYDGTSQFGNYFYAYGNIDSVTVSPATVPVPAAVWLFGSGLMGLLGAKKKKGLLPVLSV